jgi:hypothetical protein
MQNVGCPSHWFERSITPGNVDISPGFLLSPYEVLQFKETEMTTPQLNLFAGWSAYASAGAAILGMVFIFIFLGAGEPFGSLNDLSIAVQVLLMIPVALALHSALLSGARSTVSLIVLIALVFGVVALATGSVLLVLRKISLEQSFQPPFNNYWLIGIWLIIANLLALSAHTLSGGPGWLGVITGIAWITLGLGMWTGGTAAQQSFPIVVGGLVGMIGYIAWGILLARHLLRPA